MQYLKFTYVDFVTGISVADKPAANGPVFPPVAGLEFVWARESAYPTAVPEFFGTCPDESSTDVPGVLGVYSQADWETMREDELATELASKIESLWASADAYVSGYISGVAVGILTIGVLQQKPKCLAVSAWSGAVWADYYQRKAAVQPGQAVDTDFSQHGPMPHSVPELQQEVGV